MMKLSPFGMRVIFTVAALGLFLAFGPVADAAELPAKYFELIQAGLKPVEQRYPSEPDAALEKLESRPGWRHFPSAILAAAVLYTAQHPANPRQGDTNF